MNVRKLPTTVSGRAIFKDQMYDILERLGYAEAVYQFDVEWNAFNRALAYGKDTTGLIAEVKDLFLHHVTDKSKSLKLWDFASDQFKVYVTEVQAYLAELKAEELEDEVVALKTKVAELEAKLKDLSVEDDESDYERDPFDRNNPKHVFNSKLDQATPIERDLITKFWNDNPPEVIYNNWRPCYSSPRVNGGLVSFRNLLTNAAKVHVLEARVEKDREIIDRLVKELEKQQKQITDNIYALNRVYDEE